MIKASSRQTTGQTMVEYIILISLITLIAMPAIRILGQQISLTAVETGQAISPALK